MFKKAISPIISISLLVIVSVLSIVSLQIFYDDFSSRTLSGVEKQSSFEVFETGIETVTGETLYVSFPNENNVTVQKVEIEGVDCNISGEYSGLSTLNLSECSSSLTSGKKEVTVVTNQGVITESVFIKSSTSTNTLSGDPVTNSNCYDPSNVNTIGIWSGCNGMLIVDNSMFRGAASGNIGGDASFQLEYGGINYTFGDSEYNIFTGQVTNFSNLFTLTTFNQNISYWDTSNVIDMSNAFYYANGFNQPLDNWDVSNVISMYRMFGWSDYDQPLNSWNTSSVQDMSFMFISATDFNQPLNNWDTSSVTDMSTMFYVAQSFDQNLTMWCVTNFGSEPPNFTSSSSPLHTNGMKPVWGSCP